MKSIRLRTQRVTIALEFPGCVVQASTAALFSSSNPSVNNFTHLAENPKLAECLALLIGNGSLQAPYLDHSLANGNHLSAFSNSADSAIVDQLRIKSQQSFRFLRMSDCSSVPLNQAVCSFNVADYLVGERLEATDQPTTRPHG